MYNDYPSDDMRDSESFKFKAKITQGTLAAGNFKDVEIAVQIKHLSNFLRNLKTPLINYKTNLLFTQSLSCAIFPATGARTFAVTNKNINVPVVTLSAQNCVKLLEPIKSRFKQKIQWNEYQ